MLSILCDILTNAALGFTHHRNHEVHQDYDLEKDHDQEQDVNQLRKYLQLFDSTFEVRELVYVGMAEQCGDLLVSLNC